MNLLGQVFGKLTVTSSADPRVRKDGRKSTRWKCLCACGSNKEIVVEGSNLTTGHTKSCGCLRKEHKTTHGLSSHPLYGVGMKMKDRCYNPQHMSYENYGGRGIKVCDRWLESFENFYNDVLEGYSEGLQLDRRNNDGNYEPENTRWVTNQQNQMNKRSWKNGTSKYKGVCWSKASGKWVSTISKDGRVTHLGFFLDEDEAALVYNKAALELFGEYANLNTIDEKKSLNE